MDYIDDSATLDEPIDTLELELSTVDANDAQSGTRNLFVNVVFVDDTRLYEPFNHEISSISVFLPVLPSRGESRTFSLPVPSGIDRTLGDIAEVFIRKPGSDGWLMGSALLFANGNALPLIGNRNANQFLDDDDDVLLLREWSTSSLCVAPAVDAEHPLPRSGFRTLGPVLGQVSESAAVVLYRVDREGHYRLRARDALTAATVFDQQLDLEPTGRFEITGLQPERRYEFDLGFVRADVETPVVDAAGSFRTYPAEGTPGMFSFAFGSCANPDQQAGQGAWTGIRSLAQTPPPGVEPISLFVHLGDTFYFYDHMTDELVANVETMHAAHVSQRRHIEFLDMAKIVPCCGVWDDHDFAKDNTDSTDLGPTLKLAAKETWLQYWGNNKPISSNGGLSTRISHGLVDIYVLDGRFNRDKSAGVLFGQDLIEDLLVMIRTRGAQVARTVVLASGSNWNHTLNGSTEKYGHDKYETEREGLYGALAGLMGSHINGLLLLSGDSHANEIYHVDLSPGLIAPEFTSSPLTNNTDLEDDTGLEGERVARFPTGGSNGKRGFATLEIDTTHPDPEGNWTATVRYYQEAGVAQHQSRTYRLQGGQFLPV